MGERDAMPVDEVREHARRSALAGRAIWCNPHLGGEAEVWRIEYLSVPEGERGSKPELLTSFRTIHARAKKKQTDEGWHAFKPPSKKTLTRTLHHER